MGVTHNICFIVQPGEACAADRLSALIVSWKTGESLFSCWINTLHGSLFSDIGRGLETLFSPPRGLASHHRIKDEERACMHAYMLVCSRVSISARRKSFEPEDFARPAFTTV